MRRKLLLAIAILTQFNGCTNTQEESIAVDICLGNQRGVERFLNIMRRIATDEHMTFIDRSTRTRRDLDIIGQGELGSSRGGPTINVGVEGKGGLGLTAGNIGLSPYQVAVGFTNGPNSAAGLRFSDVVIRTLEKEWNVRRIPNNEGSKPLTNCG
jgi:hypothetical protein